MHLRHYYCSFLFLDTLHNIYLTDKHENSEPKEVQPEEEQALKDDFQSLREIISEEGGAKGEYL